MARPTNYVTRSDLGWSATSPAAGATPRSGLVIHYDSTNMRLDQQPHTECIAYWQRTRNFHTGPARGWVDIGYSWMACPHGYVLEGRGLGRQQAAQQGGNASHYSCTLAGGPSDPVTDDAINAVRELRLWLMESPRSNSGSVLGHRDITPSSCPGDRAYQMVQDGTFTGAPGAISPEGDPLLGTKEGDGIPNPSEAVKAVQRLIVNAGFGEELAPYGVDGQWGAKTSAGLLAARHYVNSGVASITRITGESYAQLITAVARNQARRFGGQS